MMINFDKLWHRFKIAMVIGGGLSALFTFGMYGLTGDLGLVLKWLIPFGVVTGLCAGAWVFFGAFDDE